MKRLTKSQYEDIANTIAQVRKINRNFPYVSEQDKTERECMAEQIISALADSFKLEDKQFDWNLFWYEAK